MSHTRIYRIWKQRIASGVMSRALFQQWAQAVNTRAMLFEYDGPIYPHRVLGKKTNLTNKEAVELVDTFPADGISLTDEQTQFGIEWLQKHGRKILHLPTDVISNIDRFTFHGEAHIDTMEYREQLVIQGAFPYYRIHTTVGRTVDYFCRPWQAIAYDNLRGPRGGFREITPLLDMIGAA